MTDPTAGNTGGPNQGPHQGNNRGPLAGIRVLDMTSVLLGPYATQTLAEMGADVVKLEPPSGDTTRHIGPMRNPGMGVMFVTINRGKRSLMLDLKTPAARSKLLQLLAGYDVLVTNIRPAAMARLGLDDATLATTNPRLIRANIVGYGQSGPYAARPAYDDLIQGVSGVAHLAQRAGGDAPRYVPQAIADRIVGLHAATAILAALVERGRTGLGQPIEIPMFEVMTSLVLGDHLGGRTLEPPVDDGGYARLLSPDRKPYATADGHVCAVIYNDAQWARFFAAIGQPGQDQRDPRFTDLSARTRHIDAIYAWLATIFLARGTVEWLALLDAADIPCAPVNTLAGLMDDPHLRAVGFFDTEDHPTEGRLRRMAAPVRFSAHGAIGRRPAPGLGEHTNEVLREAGIQETV